MRRLSLFGVFVALIFTASPLAAAPIIIGSPADAGTGNCFPFGCAYDGRYQQVYTGSAFAGPLTITGLQFYNTGTDGTSWGLSPATAMNSGTWTISLSTSASDWDTLSGVYAANVGADNTMVFSGDLSQPWAFGNTLSIPLATPFSYNPANGNLLMDVVVSGASMPGGYIFFDTNGYGDDFQYVGTTMGRVYSSGGGEYVNAGYGLVTGFDTPSAPIPEPATLILLSTGLVGGVARRAWRKRRG